VEPRRWTPFPVGTNVVGVGYGYAEGDIFLDPVTRIDDAEFRLHTAIGAYSRAFGVLGKTARVDLKAPYMNGRWEGTVDGTPASVRRRGFGDPRIRLSVNLFGPPALNREQFREYLAKHPVDTIAGLAISARVPWGEYKDDKLINLGQNRYVFRPQAGVLHRRGPWSFELTGSTFFFTPNDDYFGGKRLKQDPLYAAQAHVVRTFKPGLWAGAGMAYGWGGETEIDGVKGDNERGNLLFGVSFGIPINRSQGIALRYIGGRTQEDSGVDTDGVLVSWSIRF
jgi:hypothetical protein